MRRWIALAIPLAGAIATLGNVFLFSAYIFALILALLLWERAPIATSLINIALGALAPLPVNLVLAAVATYLFDYALRTGNDKPWFFYASALAASAAAALLLGRASAAAALAVPLGYILATSIFTYAKFATSQITITAEGPLRTLAGVAFRYKLKLSTEPGLKCYASIAAPRYLRIKPRAFHLDGGAVLEVRAKFATGGVKRPKIKIVLRDPRGIVKTTRIVQHPEIVVTPRAEAALEYARALLSGAYETGEEVAELREYVPGDPVRRIYWKKSAKYQRLVIKLLEEVREIPPLLVVGYASSASALDKVGGAVVRLTAEIAARGRKAVVYLLDRRGRVVKHEISAEQYFEDVTKVIKALESLNVRLVKAPDFAGILDRFAPQPRDLPRGAAVVGEATFTTPICKTAGASTCITIT